MQLLCVGDIALANKETLEQIWASPYGTNPTHDSKILFNWELPISKTLNSQPRTSGPRLLACPNSPSILQKWAPAFAALANNHILDGGSESLVNTITALQQQGFETLGAGKTSEEISKPIFWKTTEGVLALVNWVFPETHPDWLSVPGPNCWPGSIIAKQIIQDLRCEADWVLLFLHWSDELFPYPRPEDRILARELVRMGADVIVGNHPHVVRGMEIFDNCPVFYSLGNFYFADIPDGMGGWTSRGAPRNHEGLGLQINFCRGEKPEIFLRSFWNIGKQVICDRYQRAIRRANTGSRALYRLQDDKYIAWYLSKRAQFDRWEGRWHFGVLRLGLKGTLRRLLEKTSLHLHANH